MPTAHGQRAIVFYQSLEKATSVSDGFLLIGIRALNVRNPERVTYIFCSSMVLSWFLSRDRGLRRKAKTHAETGGGSPMCYRYAMLTAWWYCENEPQAFEKIDVKHSAIIRIVNSVNVLNCDDREWMGFAGFCNMVKLDTAVFGWSYECDFVIFRDEELSYDRWRF